MTANRIILLEPNNGGLAVARRIVRAGGRPTLILPPGMGWMRHSRGTDAILATGPEEYLAILERFAGEPEVLVIAGADRATEWLAEHRDRIPPSIRTFEGPGSGHLDLLDKSRAHAIARAAGVAVPWERSVASLEELDVAADAPFPCVVKPVLSHEFRGLFGEERVFVVGDLAEARAIVTAPLAAGLPMMLSEYVPGPDDAVEEAIVVRAADGSYPLAFGCRKQRQFPAGFGAASLCFSDPIPASMAVAKAVLDAAGFAGVAGVETKHHAETGVTYFIEANVRLPTQFALGDVSGADATHRVIATLAGEPLGPRPPQRPGVKLVFPELEARAALGALRNGDGRLRTARALLRSYRGVRELGLLDPRDPAPFVTRMRDSLRSR